MVLQYWIRIVADINPLFQYQVWFATVSRGKKQKYSIKERSMLTTRLIKAEPGNLKHESMFHRKLGKEQNKLYIYIYIYGETW